MTRLRIRSLKPEVWKDEALAACSRDSRLLFIGLITMADDAGRMRFTPSAIIGHVFPFDENVTPGKLRSWLDQLEHGGLIEFYENDSRRYLWLPGWRKHQKINRPTASQLPPPPDPSGSWFPHDGLSEKDVSAHGASREEGELSASPHARADRIGSDQLLPPGGGMEPSAGAADSERARVQAAIRESLHLVDGGAAA